MYRTKRWLANDAVLATYISAGEVKTSSIAADNVRATHLHDEVLFKKGAVASQAIGASGYIAVSTGLASPVYCLGVLRSSTTGGCPLTSFDIKFYKASGSYALFRFTKGHVGVVTASYVAFSWEAFET